MAILQPSALPSAIPHYQGNHNFSKYPAIGVTLYCWVFIAVILQIPVPSYYASCVAS